MSLRLACLLATMLVHAAQASSHCGPSMRQCEFHFHINQKFTMNKDGMALKPYEGRLCHYDSVDCTTDPLVDPQGVVIADGFTNRMVVVVNGQMPGPAVEVYEGQDVVVHVSNHLSTETVSIHWHGLQQRGTPWMDGTAFVTQCPIAPSQSFTYRFNAQQKGTHYYQGTVGTNLANGLVGAFIVHERPASPLPFQHGNPAPTPKPDEHIMLIQDWNHDIQANDLLERVTAGHFMYSTDPNVIIEDTDYLDILPTTHALDGARFPGDFFQSGLINGRGRYMEEQASLVGNEAPLTHFYVVEGETYRFRMIGAGSMYPFRVSVDEHSLVIVALDGNDVEQTVVQSVVVQPGERYDFLLTATKPSPSNSLYWVRAESMEVGVVGHVAVAILDYGEGQNGDPTSSPDACDDTTDPCPVLNCPFGHYAMDVGVVPAEHYIDCISVDRLHNAQNHELPGGRIHEHFFNFAMPTTLAGDPHCTVNGKRFQHLPISALTQSYSVDDQCDIASPACGPDAVCSCASSMELRNGGSYQFVLMNLGSGAGQMHPVHLHGHAFYVLKTGFAPQNEASGMRDGTNGDVECLDAFCNVAQWRNPSWGGDNIPGLKMDFAVQKDTITIPAGGYVIIRLEADNPGLWLMHDMVEVNRMLGMAVMMNESYAELPKVQGGLPQAPVDFPTCGDFPYDKGLQPLFLDTPTMYREATFWIIAALMMLIIILLIIIIIYCANKTKTVVVASP